MKRIPIQIRIGRVVRGGEVKRRNAVDVIQVQTQLPHRFQIVKNIGKIKIVFLEIYLH